MNRAQVERLAGPRQQGRRVNLMVGRPPKVPKGLCHASRTLWAQLQREYGITDSGGLAMLSLTAQAYKRMLEARAALDRDGITIETAKGGLRPHPAVVIERDSRIAVVACLRQLGLDLEPLREQGGRPPGR
jgi:P27 family predicted phage terminase small subunit